MMPGQALQMLKLSVFVGKAPKRKIQVDFFPVVGPGRRYYQFSARRHVVCNFPSTRYGGHEQKEVA